jgi:hypothetical protein
MKEQYGTMEFNKKWDEMSKRTKRILLRAELNKSERGQIIFVDFKRGEKIEEDNIVYLFEKEA